MGIMKILTGKDVYQAAIERTTRIFNDFENIIVSTSGGKDSTVTLNIALEVATTLNRLPLKVMFLDQEAEWQCVIDHIKELKEDPRIELLWYQIPIKIENATSSTDSYLITWEEGKQWMREMEPSSIRTKFNTQVFYDLFTNILSAQFPGQKACYLAGVRTEESPARFTALTSRATYKDMTFGKILDKKVGQYTFYPLYDWSYTDVWKAIHSNKWLYSRVYDYMFQYGVQIQAMRVSNLNHETATHALYYLPEIEKHTWEALCARLSGINTVSKISKHDMLSAPKDVPPMFTGWKEYRDHLLNNMILNADIHKIMKDKFEKMDIKYELIGDIQTMYKAQITTILANDSWLTKLTNWERRPEVHGWRLHMKGKYHIANLTNKHILKMK